MAFPFVCEEPGWTSPQLTHTVPQYLLPDSSQCLLPTLSDLALPAFRLCHSEVCMRPFVSHPSSRYLPDLNYPPIFHPLNEDIIPPMSPWLDTPSPEQIFRQQKANELLQQLQHLLQVQQQQAFQDPCEIQSMLDQGLSTNAACASCYRSKLSCDKQRPCSRCVKSGRECVSRAPVKLGRPRKRDSFDARTAVRNSMYGPFSREHPGKHCKKSDNQLSLAAEPWFSKVKDEEVHRQICENIVSMDMVSLEVPSQFDFRQHKPKLRPKISSQPAGSRKRPWSQDNPEKRPSTVTAGHGEVEFNLEGVIHDDSFFEVSDSEWAELQEQSSSVRFAVLLTCEIARMSEMLIEKCSRNYYIVWSLCSLLSKQTKKIDFVRLLMRVWSTAYHSVFPHLIWNDEEDDSAQPDFHLLDNLSLTAALPPEIITLLDSSCVLTTTVVLENAPEVNALPFAVLRMRDVNQDETALTTYVSYNQNFVQLFGYEGQEVVEIIQRCLFFEQVVLEEDWHILTRERITSFCNHTPFMPICVRIVTKSGDIHPVVISFHRQWTGSLSALTYAVITYAPIS